MHIDYFTQSTQLHTGNILEVFVFKSIVFQGFCLF